MSLFSRKPKGNPAASPVRARFGVSVPERLDANPAVQRVVTDTAQIYYQHDFLTPAQCDALIAMIDSNRRPSTLLSDRPDYGFRTSESCDMNRWSPDVQPIDESIADLLGIAPEQGETMQGQRYAPGQQFRAHHDYFHESESYWEKVRVHGGQRTWTAMIYLNDVPEGGATWFPQAGIRVAPRRGLLLAWNNMKLDGSPNEMTLHEGMPVVEGVKYVITKWFREGNWVS
ncbi:prolyl 4-hydroxylase [Sphingomonas sp. SORGH_AS 950]|uniref:prolyl hydroxylase family protein n=1 Tax=unclassified Sphingomonas TaxID=196159 RepID=UPI00277DA673|nr:MULTISPECIES: 2OG-Fe(II) oxygenase [unclassified Sphingomonas]MDQ1159361.1 prolyl 4-hydroxylase [Sphingomonas sp. SORGH_AS_0950]MDR6116509.1 prolyl 4-hydroxylase [Sphingomonas sp. SORGH_AS_0789]